MGKALIIVLAIAIAGCGSSDDSVEHRSTVAVVGAGAAGLASARRLADASGRFAHWGRS